jgi:RecG-like helicase
VHTVARLKPAAAAAGTEAARAPFPAALGARLARLGVHLPQDLLFLLPLRYEDRTRLWPIGTVMPGAAVQVEGEVLLAEIVFRRRRQLLVRIADGSGSLTLRFFHFSNAQREGLARGTRIRCHGEVRRGPLGPEIIHPEYRRLDEGAAPLAQTLTPVYPATEGITQGRLRVPRLLNICRRRCSSRSAFPRLRPQSNSFTSPRSAPIRSSWPPGVIRRSGAWPSRSCWHTSSR